MQSGDWYPGTTSIAEETMHLQGLNERKHDSGYLIAQITGNETSGLAARSSMLCAGNGLWNHEIVLPTPSSRTFSRLQPGQYKGYTAETCSFSENNRNTVKW